MPQFGARGFFHAQHSYSRTVLTPPHFNSAYLASFTMIKRCGVACPRCTTRPEFDGCLTEPVYFWRAGLPGHQLHLLDRCPFSVLVRLISHDVSGGWGGYRNHAAVTKVEAQGAASWFRGCSHEILLDVQPCKTFPVREL